MRIIIEQTSALLIDVQERLFPHMYERETLGQNLSMLLKGLRILGIPLLVTQQYTKGLGPTIPSLQETLGWTTSSAFPDQKSAASPDPDATPTLTATPVPAECTPYIEKIAFSCFDEPAFAKALEALGRKRVVLAGIEAHVCVLQTAVDLQQAGYTPVVIENCTSSRRENDKRIAFERFRAEGILVSTYESILFELTREAGTETFKAISNLVK
jgi:nicotinamidase-related amidase